MKKEELFNIIGEVDEQKIAAAGMAMNTKKKFRPAWVKWGATAACLCLVVVGALIGPSLISNPPAGDIDTPPVVADIAPMVCINNTLYKQSAKQISYAELKEEFVYLGEVESEVSSDNNITDGIPKKNFQANHAIVGSKVYQFGNDIVVEINGKYWLYEHFDESNTENGTVEFHGKMFNKADLSEETLEWLEKYNEMSKEEQLAISRIPNDLYELCGYVATDNSEVNGSTD